MLYSEIVQINNSPLAFYCEGGHGFIGVLTMALSHRNQCERCRYCVCNNADVDIHLSASAHWVL